MANSDWEIISLDGNHDRAAFDCGEELLNLYLKQYANQHVKNKMTKIFVAVEKKISNKILGFYGLSAGSISFENLPEKLQKMLPRYPIPVARLGRLAVDKVIQGYGLGEHLLMDALYRCISLTNEIGITGVVVDAKHEKAKNFYLKYGFAELTNMPLTLFIHIKDIISTI